MRDVFVASDNIFSPIGDTTGENLFNLENNTSGVTQHQALAISDVSFFAAIFDQNRFSAEENQFTKFEQLLVASVSDALKNCAVNPSDPKTILILSTTKGNISLLESGNYDPRLKERISLHTSAKKIAEHFNFVNTPVIISNACISGVLAMLTGMRMLRSGQYDHAVIAGADVISRFILSGFQSFQAISNELCKPFDAARKGINLGEGAGTIVLSADKKYADNVKVAGGAVSNDANHISGPSRTGEELCIAINAAIKDAAIPAKEIDFISAHGTATLFNDEMEAKAITLAGLQAVPVNSLKGFYGHTLGAAGIIESIISLHSLKSGKLYPTKGFDTMGVSVPLNISNKIQKASLKNILKTASGFGGCNAAIVMRK